MKPKDNQKNGIIQSPLKSTEEKIAPVGDAQYWQSRYEDNLTQWDLENETGVFTAIREQGVITNHWNKPAEEIALWIPGCGNGYDAVGYARTGFKVTAVDFAEAPISRLKNISQDESLSLNPLQADVFNLPEGFSGQYECVLEYTCYCAIDPKQRQEYAHIIADTLKNGGMLIGLFFPLGGTNTTTPPFGVTQKEITDHFIHAGLSLKTQYFPKESHPAREGKEIVMIFEK